MIGFSQSCTPLQNGRELCTVRSMSVVGRRKRALLDAIKWGEPQPDTADPASEAVVICTTEWLTASAMSSEGRLPLEVQLRVPDTIGTQYQGRIQDFGTVARAGDRRVRGG